MSHLRSNHRRTPRRSKRRGSGLIELTVSTMLVGVLMAAALTATGQALLAQRKGADRVVGQQLANALLAEVLQKSYSEPGATLPLIGVDLLEVASLRSSFDDVDDYDGHTESPPTATDGTVISGYTGWRRTVSVAWVDATTLAPSGSDAGVKRVTVAVTFGGVPVYSATGYRVNVP